jgi:hypothetical protein
MNGNIDPDFTIIAKVAQSNAGPYLLIFFVLSIFFLWLCQERAFSKPKPKVEKPKTLKQIRKERWKKFE